MNEERKIEKVVRKVTFKEAEEEDIIYWAQKSIKERVTAATEWNKKVWTHLHGSYPEKIEKYGGKRIKDHTDEDDF